jgi:hypothetical protein
MTLSGIEHATWLTVYATSRNVVVSISGYIIEFFNYIIDKAYNK